MKKLTLLVLTLSVLVSCKKDKTCNKDMAGMSGSYKVTAATYRSTPTGTEQDYYSTLYSDACERDDIITLNSNGTYVFTDAGVKCVPSGDDTGTWNVSGNNITIDGQTEQIESFDCSRLVILEVDAIIAGDRLKIVLSRQ